jgi:hypothetical protein
MTRLSMYVPASASAAADIVTQRQLIATAKARAYPLGNTRLASTGPTIIDRSRYLSDMHARGYLSATTAIFQTSETDSPTTTAKTL